jgi:hypothetical protein
MQYQKTANSQAAPSPEIVDRFELSNPLYGEGKAHPLFQPDIILPSQDRDSHQRRTAQDPEKRLMLAVLEDAVGCFRNGLNARDHRRRELFKDSEGWITEENGDWLFSFEHICDILGLDARLIRNELLKWKKETVKRGGQAKVLSLARSSEERSRDRDRSAAKPRQLQNAAGF